MNISSGVGPFDAQMGGLRAGGLYLLAGAPGVGKLPFLMQFLAAGLEADERLAFLGGYSPEELFERTNHWGLAGLEDAWNEDRLAVLGYRGEFSRRMLEAPSPEDALHELTDLLGGPVSRLAIDPGTLLWETRAGTAMATAFSKWQEGMGATVVATAATELNENLPRSTEWIIERATGVFHIARLRNGLRELTVVRVHPPQPDPGPITFELDPAAGLVVPPGTPGRRSGDAPTGKRSHLLLLRLTEGISSDVEAWLARQYQVGEARDPAELASRLREESWGGVCIAVERSGIDGAIELTRQARLLTGGAIVLLSRGQLRSSDRARAMEAGADDVLRQDVGLRELQSRFRRAAAVVQRDRGRSGADDRPTPIEALLDQETFASEVAGRLTSPAHGYLTLVVVPESVGEPVVEALRGSMRVQAGDFAGLAPGGFGVVLQDARGRHARVFLERALRSLGPTSGAPQVTILTSPEEAAGIRTALGVAE